MKAKIELLFDEDFRKEIKSKFLEIANSIPREEISATIKAEMERVTKQAVASASMHWNLAEIAKEQIRGLFASRSPMWEGELRKAVREAADEEILQKLKNKTVWEAEKQDAYIRKVVREELKKMLASS